MNNVARGAIYLRDRSDMTPAQRRRFDKHERREVAAIPPSLRRAARRDVLRRDSRMRAAIGSMFRRPA